MPALFFSFKEYLYKYIKYNVNNYWNIKLFGDASVQI